MVKINEILEHKITRHIAGWGIKKLMDRTPVKFQVCLNKLTCRFGREIDAMTKNIISCDIEHVDMRDEGGLRWPYRIIVMLTGIIIKKFERFLDCEDWMNEYFLS